MGEAGWSFLADADFDQDGALDIGERIRASRFAYFAEHDVDHDGQWSEGQIDGLGIATYVNGDIYEGTFRAGVPQGEGLMRYATGEERLGVWDKGELVEETLPDPATEESDGEASEAPEAPAAEAEAARDARAKVGACAHEIL